MRDRLVLLKRPDVTAVWGYSPKTGVYHATVNGLRPCCRSTTVLVSCIDPSDSTMMCERCIGMVRRVLADPTEARRVALERAVKRIQFTALPPVEPRCSSGKVYRNG